MEKILVFLRISAISLSLLDFLIIFEAIGFFIDKLIKNHRKESQR